MSCVDALSTAGLHGVSWKHSTLSQKEMLSYKEHIIVELAKAMLKNLFEGKFFKPSQCTLKARKVCLELQQAVLTF